MFICAVSLFTSPCLARGLQVKNFNALYSAASNRRIDIIARAIGRGMNIDSINANGDTGLCVAIRNGDRVAYQVFSHFGAEQNHSCILRIPQSQYSRFMASVPSRQTGYTTSASSRYAALPVQNRYGPYQDNLYTSNWLKSPVTWTIGGVALAAGGIALAGKKGGGSSKSKAYAYQNSGTSPSPGPGPSPKPVIDFDLSTLSGVGGDPIIPQENIDVTITNPDDLPQEDLWAVYASENKNIANPININVTEEGNNEQKNFWGAIYAKNGYIYNAGVIEINSTSKYAAALMACVVDSYTINTACFTNDDNPIGGDIYNDEKGELNITANQSRGIFTGNTQTITNAGHITMNGDDNTGIFVYGSANKIINNGSISLEGAGTDYYAGSMNGIWVKETADITNNGTIDIQNSTSTANGIYSKDGTITNSETGTITIKGSGAGLKTNQGTLNNQGTIDITNTLENSTYGMKVDTSGTAINSKDIKITNSGYGIYVASGTATNESTGTITLTHTPGNANSGYAMYGNGTITNNGIISSTSGGMEGDNLINNNKIESDGIALHVEGNEATSTDGYAENNGTITSQSYGFYAQKKGAFKNTGTITSSAGIRTDSGNIINSGTITSTTTGIDTVSDTITNSGTINSMNHAISTAQSTIENQENATIINSISSEAILAETICMKGDRRCENVSTDDEEYSLSSTYKSAKLTFNNAGTLKQTNGGTAVRILGDANHDKTPSLTVNNSGLIKIENISSYSDLVGIDALGYEEEAEEVPSGDSEEEFKELAIKSTATIVNTGTIEIDNRGTDRDSDITGIVINKGTITNSGTLNIYNDQYTHTDKNVIGIKIGEGTATNTGTIRISSNNAIGMWAEYSGNPDNLKEDEIKAEVINDVGGTIELIGQNNIGLYAKGKGSAVSNAGTIIVREQSTADPFVRDGDTVYSETDKCNEFVCLEDGAVYINSGVLKSEKSLSFNKLGGKTLLAKGSKISAPSMSGTVYADYDLVTDNFENVTTTGEDSLVGDTSDLEIQSLSALYTAQLVSAPQNTTVTTSGISNQQAANAIMLMSLSPSSTPLSIPSQNHSIQLTRKSFYNFTNNSSVGEYLENNYALGNNVNFYNDLKETSSDAGISRKIEQNLGLKFFPSFSEQVLNNLRNINTDITDRLINNDNDDNIRSTIGITSHYRKRDDTSNILGYEDKLQSVFGVVDWKYNSDLRLGLGLNYARSDTKYDDESKRKNNILQIFAPFMYNNSTYKLISTPHIGYIWGNYNRHTDDASYKGSTKAFYYGLTNELSTDIALEYFILEPNAELNISGLYSNAIKDEQGVNVEEHNDISAEIGIGLYLKKRFEFAKNRSLSFRAGGSSYLEMLDPYKNLHGKMSGMTGSYIFNKPTKSKTHSVLKTSVKYQQDNINLIGELNKYLEDSKGYEVNLNMQYDIPAQ